MATMLRLGCFTLLLGLLIVPSCGDLSHMFTALAHMSGLVEVEGELLNELDTYIAAEEKRLAELKVFAHKVRKAQDIAKADPRSHVLHPTNAMGVIHRFHKGWSDRVPSLLYETNYDDLLATISLHKYRFPTDADFSGAVLALARLQDTYQISPYNLTQPELGGRQSVHLTAKDCFDIGRVSYLTEDWWYTKEWMLEVIRKVDQGDDQDVSLVEVYDHLSFAEYSLGNIRRAKQFTKDLLQNEPDHERAQNNLAHFEELLENDPNVLKIPEPLDRKRVLSEEMFKYEDYCREGKEVPKEKYHMMVCFFYTNNMHPHLVLKPAKIEVAYLKPRVYLLKGLVLDYEIRRLMELGEPKLNRATVFDANGKMVYSTIRTSKSAWLDESDDPSGVLTDINTRISAITGLDLTTAELLQVCNYGIGGHYDPHYDFSTREGDLFSGDGRRIATVLMYLTNVELGGATVFTVAGAHLTPSKGDAAFWWNIKRSGEGDLSTRHAACPVLVGSKWVCNKWIHERGQEFRRKCAPEEYK